LHEGAMGMARRFALYLKDGHEVRNNIEEIREYFDYGKMVEYFHDGSLQQWLDDRRYEAESIALSVLDGNAPDFQEKLCYIFRVDSASIEPNDIITDDEEIIKKKAVIRQYTTDDKVLDAIDSVATNQDELQKLLSNNPMQIYLCGSEFTITAKGESIKYIGVGTVTVKISHDDIADIEKKNITFENINIDVQESDKKSEQATDTHAEEIVHRFMERNGIEKFVDTYSQENRDADIALEILSCLINGKTKQGEYIWDSRSEIEWPYTLKEFKGKLSIPKGGTSYSKIRKWIESGKEKIIFMIEPEYSGELLVFSEKAMYYYSRGEGSYRCAYADVTNVTVPLRGIVNIYLNGEKCIRMRRGGTVNVAGDETVRLFLTIMGKLHGRVRGSFLYYDRVAISNISLECLNGEKLLRYLEKRKSSIGNKEDDNLKESDYQQAENADNCSGLIIDDDYNVFVSELFARIMNVDENLRDVSYYSELNDSFYRDIRTEIKDNKEKVIYLGKGVNTFIVITTQAIRVANAWTCRFADIENISIRRTGRMDIYRKSGILYLKRENLSVLNPDALRLFLLVIAKLYYNIGYYFTNSEMEILNGIVCKDSKSSIGEMITQMWNY